MLDNSYINRQYNQLSKSDKDFIRSNKKLVHEGTKVFRTKSWKKVYLNTKKKYQEEHPGYVVKEFPKFIQYMQL